MISWEAQRNLVAGGLVLLALMVAGTVWAGLRGGELAGESRAGELGALPRAMGDGAAVWPWAESGMEAVRGSAERVGAPVYRLDREVWLEHAAASAERRGWALRELDWERGDLKPRVVLEMAVPAAEAGEAVSLAGDPYRWASEGGVGGGVGSGDGAALTLVEVELFHPNSGPALRMLMVIGAAFSGLLAVHLAVGVADLWARWREERGPMTAEAPG